MNDVGYRETGYNETDCESYRPHEVGIVAHADSLLLAGSPVLILYPGDVFTEYSVSLQLRQNGGILVFEGQPQKHSQAKVGFIVIRSLLGDWWASASTLEQG